MVIIHAMVETRFSVQGPKMLDLIVFFFYQYKAKFFQRFCCTVYLRVKGEKGKTEAFYTMYS